MAKIAILGFGTVGSGVYEVLQHNAASVARRAGEPVEVKYILDVRDFSSRPDGHLFVKNIDVILADPEVKVVVGDHRRHPLCLSLCQAGAGQRPQCMHLQQGDGGHLWRRAAGPGQKPMAAPFCLKLRWGAAPPSSPPCISACGQCHHRGGGYRQRHHQLYA